MKNPWKRYSKINPQRENGTRQIHNDVFHALVSGKLTGAEYKIILAVIDKTWGYNKTEAAISIKDFSGMTNLSSRMVKYSLKRLKSIRVLYSSPLKSRVQSGSPLNEYAVNKHYDTWILQGCNVVHPGVQQMVNRGAMDGKIGVQGSSPSPIKEKLLKKVKETPLPPLPDFVDPELFNQFLKMRKKLKAVNSEFAVKLLVKKFNEFHTSGFDVNKIIETSIENSWKSVFEPKTKQRGTVNGESELQRKNQAAFKEAFRGTDGEN